MLGVTDYGAFVIAFIIVLAIPGPGNFALITATGKGGIKAGMAATCGVILGDQVLLWLAVAGVATLLAAYPAAFHVVQWAGAAYLAYLGLRMLLSKPGGAPRASRMDNGHYLRHVEHDRLGVEQGDHVLHGVFPAVRRPGEAPGAGDLWLPGGDRGGGDVAVWADCGGVDPQAG